MCKPFFRKHFFACNLQDDFSVWSRKISSWPSTPRRRFYRHASLCLHQICDYIVRNAIKIMAQNLNFVEPKIIVPTGLYTVGAWLDGECKANSFTVQRINTYMLAFASYFSSSLQSSQFDWLQRHEFRNFVAISESVIFNSVYIDLGRAAQSTLTRTL